MSILPSPLGYQHLQPNQKEQLEHLFEALANNLHTVSPHDKDFVQKVIQTALEWKLPYEAILILLLYLFKQNITLLHSKQLQFLSQNTDDKASKLVRFDRYSPLNESDLLKKAERASKLRQLFYTAYVDVELGLLALLIHIARMECLEDYIEWIDHSYLSQICEENDEVYIPFTEMLGCWELRSRIGDLSLRLNNPKKNWNEISRGKEEILPLITKYFEIVISELTADFISEGIVGSVEPHISSNSSVYRRLQKETSLSEILIQARVDVVVRSEADCYQALRAIHRRWEPVLGRLMGSGSFRDLIAAPKFTGYSALTTKVFFSNERLKNRPLEFRIMTEQIRKVNAHGVLFRYLFDPKLRIKNAWWQDVELREFVAKNPIGSTTETIYVFSPIGRIYRGLPKGSTPIDYGYKIHSEVGNHMKRVWINGQRAPYSQRLVNGDLVQMELDPNYAGPDPKWLKAARSLTARTQIKKELSKRTLPKGRQIIDKILSSEIQKYELQQEVTQEEFQAHLDGLAVHLDYSDLNALYVDIAEVRPSLRDKSTISPDKIVARFLTKKLSPFIIRSDGKPITYPQRIHLVQCNHDKLSRRISPGTEIVGRVRFADTVHEKMLVYRKDCPDAPKGKNAIPLEWRKSHALGQPAKIEINAVDRMHLLGDILEAVYREYDNGIYLLGVQAFVDRNREAEVKMTVEAETSDQIKALEDRLNGLKSSSTIHRITINPLSLLEKILLREHDILPNPYTALAVSEPRLFKGREAEIDKILTAINSNQNLVVLYGTNRVGKTSLLKYFCNVIAPEYKIIPVFLDMQPLPDQSESEFWLELRKAIQAAISRAFPGKKFQYRTKTNRSNSYENFSAWLEELSTLWQGWKILIMIDEMNIVDERWNSLEAKRLVQRIKSLIERQEKVKFIISVQQTFYMQSLSSIDAKTPITSPLLTTSIHIPLDYLDKVSAEKLINEPMGKMLSFQSDAVERILFLTAYHPYYLQNMLYQIVDYLNTEKRTYLTADDVNHITEDTLLKDDLLFYHVQQAYKGFKQFVLSALAMVGGTNSQSVSIRDIQETLEAKDIPVETRGLIATLEELVALSIIRRCDHVTTAYSFRVPLFAMWLLKNKPLDLVVAAQRVVRSPKHDMH